MDNNIICLLCLKSFQVQFKDLQDQQVFQEMLKDITHQLREQEIPDLNEYFYCLECMDILIDQNEEQIEFYQEEISQQQKQPRFVQENLSQEKRQEIANENMQLKQKYEELQQQIQFLQSNLEQPTQMESLEIKMDKLLELQNQQKYFRYQNYQYNKKISKKEKKLENEKLDLEKVEVYNLLDSCFKFRINFDYCEF